MYERITKILEILVIANFSYNFTKALIEYIQQYKFEKDLNKNLDQVKLRNNLNAFVEQEKKMRKAFNKEHFSHANYDIEFTILEKGNYGKNIRN